MGGAYPITITPLRYRGLLKQAEGARAEESLSSRSGDYDEMAIQWHSNRVDDLTGKISDDVEEFTFELDGVTHRMDACLETRNEVRKALEKFTQVSTVSSVKDSKAVREWANSNGYSVHPKGKIPKQAFEAYVAYLNSQEHK